MFAELAIDSAASTLVDGLTLVLMWFHMALRVPDCAPAPPALAAASVGGLTVTARRSRLLQVAGGGVLRAPDGDGCGRRRRLCGSCSRCVASLSVRWRGHTSSDAWAAAEKVMLRACGTTHAVPCGPPVPPASESVPIFRMVTRAEAFRGSHTPPNQCSEFEWLLAAPTRSPTTVTVPHTALSSILAKRRFVKGTKAHASNACPPNFR